MNLNETDVEAKNLTSEELVYAIMTLSIRLNEECVEPPEKTFVAHIIKKLATQLSELA